MPGGLGAPGGSGGPGGGASGPADFRNAHGAVNAFLSAVRAKDAEKLAEATALHAPTEAVSVHNQKIFTAIIEQSLAPEDLDELAKKLEGMQIVGENQAKSSGRLGITVGKSGKNGDYYTRTITVRKEKSGWKVSDIGGLGEFKSPVNNRTSAGRGRR